MLFILTVFSIMTSCKQGSDTTVVSAEPTVERNEIMDVIRNPATANDAEVDTSSLARFQFKEDRHDFGEVDAGAVIKHTFSFKNDGEVPLLISDVRSTCGCTVAKWPKAPIAPGKTGEIPVEFDTKNKNGRQSKPITITANTFPAQTVLHLDGRVYGTTDNS